MNRTLALVMTAFLPMAALAADATAPENETLIRPAGESDLSEFLWTNRPIVVFADTPSDPRFEQQINMLAQGEEMLRDREVVVLTDTDPAARGSLRSKLRPRGFQLVLIGKDGGVKLRKPFPWSVRELSRSIDKFPLREQELRERRGIGAEK
ncbi:DUF4174 domain-containing protein [Primorskyibacter sp. S87]|uniref:DUF4174 domain-containing protein n=1 Tax=Primorskyibacter sp. S87 TaxID=3415126 RepID=UPI003C7AFAF8